jgi:hypothetical protein
MKKLILSLPQIECSVFIMDYVRYCIQRSSKDFFDIYVISKNSMDEDTMPCVIHPKKIMSINDMPGKDVCVVNLDPDPLIIDSLKERSDNFCDMSELIYSDIKENLWKKISNYFEIEYTDPKFRLAISLKSKSNRAESGVAIRSDDLRHYVKTSFFADNDRLWHVPVRKNLIKRYDECNTVENLITDDYFCALSAYSCGKKVIFLKLYKSTFDISIGESLYMQDASEFFNGNKIEKIAG